MAFPGLALLDSVPVVNSAYALAAAQAHGLPFTCAPCSGSAWALEEAPYVGTPSVDQPPWYDPAAPESARFLGVMGLAVSGLSDDPLTRPVDELVGDGAALGALRRTSRSIVWQVLLIALDDAAMAYGQAWLASALRGAPCGTCDGSELCVYTACPSGEINPLTGDPAELRHLYKVGLTKGLSEDARTYLSQGGLCDHTAQGCCTGTDLQPQIVHASFTLTAGVPQVYSGPITFGPDDWVPLAKGTVVRDYDPDAVVCSPTVACTDDPECPDPPLPPPVPVPVSPCWPAGPDTWYSSWLSTTAATLAQWAEYVPLLEIQADPGAALRRVVVRFFLNPQSADCTIAGAEPCAACTDVGIGYIPAASTLTLDGRTRRAWIDCSTQSVTGYGTPRLYGPAGRAFTWPELVCPVGMCVQVLTPATATGPAARARVRLVARKDAA